MIAGGVPGGVGSSDRSLAAPGSEVRLVGATDRTGGDARIVPGWDRSVVRPTASAGDEPEVEYAVVAAGDATVPVRDESTGRELLPDGPARDPDDGRSEDVTGDGEATAAAVTLSFASRGAPSAGSGGDAFDSDGTGRLGPDDVATAFDASLASLASLDESP